MNKEEFKFVPKENNLDLEQTRKSLTYWQDVWRRLRKNRMSMFGLIVVMGIVLFGVIGPLFTDFTFADQTNELRNLPPKLDVYEIEDNVFIHRSKDYRLIEFNPEGYVVNVLDSVNKDEDDKVYKYAYILRLGLIDVESKNYAVPGTYPLPAEVTLNPDAYYSEMWGLALVDRETPSGDIEVVIEYIHPDSPIHGLEITEGSYEGELEGLILDFVVMIDEISNPDLADSYSIRNSRKSRMIIREMDEMIDTDDDNIDDTPRSKLESIRLYTDIITLDFSLLNTPKSERPEGYEDVEYVFEYKGEETTEITDTFKNKTYPWGTDDLGRDLLTRTMYGTRISLLVALIATLVNFIIGIAYGSISGYYGGNVDNLMMRWVDVINSIPLILYVILLMVVLKEITFDLGPIHFRGSDGFTAIVIALGSVYWVGMARLVRGQVLGLKEQEYVLAARTIGVSTRKIITRHLVPNALGPIIVSMAMMIPSAVFTEAFLSFIGIGVSAPQASLGTLANAGRASLASHPYQLFYPSMAIALAMLGFNFLGDGLRDALDPRLRKG